MRNTDILDQTLVQMNALDGLTVRDACQGIFYTGAPGAGKSSSSNVLKRAFLIAGMGGLVLCAKGSEADEWQTLAQQCGRGALFYRWRDASLRFNPIAYELAKSGSAGLNSVVELIMRMQEFARMCSASPGRPNESFWDDTSRQILRATVPVTYAATGTVSIEHVLNFIRSAPTSPEQMTDPQWQAGSFFYAMFRQAASRLDGAAGQRAVSYWKSDFAMLDPKTRGNILISLTTALDRLNHGWLREVFCTDSNIAPELCFQGVTIVMDLPALVLHEDGILAQLIFKYIFQRAVLARDTMGPGQSERPVYLWVDEAQYFLTSQDAEYLSTCRALRACTVFLSQSLPSLYARMGGDNARERVHQLLGNFTTRIFCANGCAETNEWAARTLGRVAHYRSSYNENEGSSVSFGRNMGTGANEGRNWGGSTGSSSSGKHSSSTSSSSWGGSEGTSNNWGRNRGTSTNHGTSHGYSEQMDHLIEPGAFGRMLKTGGPSNGNRVSAVWYQAGRCFRASGGNALLVEYQQ